MYIVIIAIDPHIFNIIFEMFYTHPFDSKTLKAIGKCPFILATEGALERGGKLSWKAVIPWGFSIGFKTQMIW